MIKIDKIRLINFQSHEDSEISFGDGLNVIIGGSDQGKTAIIRALRWLLYNEPRGTDFIRVGANSCKVILTLADGTKISRERNINRNIYTLTKATGEEEIYEGFGSEIPQEIISAHGMGKVYLDRDLETSLNIAYQLDSPFLLSGSGAVRAKAIGRIVGIHLVDNAIRNVIKDLYQLSQNEKQVNNRLQTLERELIIYANLENEGKLLERTNNLLLELEQNLILLDKIKNIADKINVLNLEKSKQEEVLAKFMNIPHWELAYDKIINCSQFLKRLALLQDKEIRVKRYLERTRLIIKDTVNVFQAERELNILINDCLPKLENYKKLKLKHDSVQVQIQKDRLLLKKLEKLKLAESYFKNILDNYEIQKKIRDLKQKTKEVEIGIEKGRNFLINNKEQIKKLVIQYNSVLESVGFCPFCYNRIGEAVRKRIMEQYQKEADL